NKVINSITEKKHCSAECRFHDGYIIQENGCWNWTKNITPLGQPFFNFKRRKFQARRFALGKVTLAELGKDVVIYTCGSKTCVNPDHLKMRTAAIEQSKRKGYLTP